MGQTLGQTLLMALGDLDADEKLRDRGRRTTTMMDD
jgi:hypothetical protein